MGAWETHVECERRSTYLSETHVRNSNTSNLIYGAEIVHILHSCINSSLTDSDITFKFHQPDDEFVEFERPPGIKIVLLIDEF